MTDITPIIISAEEAKAKTEEAINKITLSKEFRRVIAAASGATDAATEAGQMQAELKIKDSKGKKAHVLSQYLDSLGYTVTICYNATHSTIEWDWS